MRTRTEGYAVIDIVVYFLLLSFKPTFSYRDFITANQSIHDNETLVSAGGTFEAGFFDFGNSQRRYFGIRYKSMSPGTVVWVANRDIPVENSAGVFKVTDGVNLVVLNGTGVAVWSSNASRTAEKPVIQLLDSGNLVLRDGNNNGSLLWESFDYPGDTLLLGMKLKSNLATGQYTSVTSWRSSEDPGQGEFSYHIDPHGFPQLVTTKNATLVYRAGPWNGYLFSGFPWQRLHKVFNFSFAFDGTEVSYECGLLDHSIVTRVTLNPSGFSQRLIWSDRTESWELYAAGPIDPCEYYAICGANSNCIVNKTPVCECLQGFMPKSQEKWNSNNWTDGCVRRRNLNCHNGDGFLKYTEMKLPDTSSSWFDKNMSRGECESTCLKNCSCTAYANLDIRGSGSGCLLWFGNIFDLRKHASDGQDIYIRQAASELGNTNYGQPFNRKKLSGVIVGAAVFFMIVFGLIICIQKKNLMHPGIVKLIYWKNKKEKEDIDLPIFDFSIISNATNNFSESNKLGQGGFGAVYKGLIADGQEIAVKRLSETSGQGTNEFKNEVLLISKLQHRNLVKLLGCSIQHSEKLLIYEFMPHRSLDYFIFDSTRSKQLNWTKRLEIIGGIARGLLYLHQDSRLRIIHRDLKASNILLDCNMNPKISDFGLAKIFGGDQVEEESNTNRVMGTYGYMPPEYAVHGSFSVKSDVFSFGVIVLEVISGRKNRGFSDPDHHLNLLGHAWRLWNEEKPVELMDKSLEDSVTPSEILRYVHVGLLCVQKRPDDRPNMASVVLMLNGEKLLPVPSQPGFYTGRDYPTQADCSQITSEGHSLNEVSISMLEAR